MQGAHNDSTTTFTFENTSDSRDVLDQATIGEVISINDLTSSPNVGDLGEYPKEFLFCKKTSGPSGGTLTYSRAYGGNLIETAPFAYADQDAPIIERGLGFNIGITDDTSAGAWEAGTYEFWQSFVYDGNQESLPLQMGDGDDGTNLDAGTHSSDGSCSWKISVYADLAYNGRISGGRIYTRLKDTNDDLVLLADIDIVKGVRLTLDAEYVSWSFKGNLGASPPSGYGYYVKESITDSPNLDTYTTINGFSPDVKFISIGGLGEMYKSAVVAGRRTFIANVRVKGEGGELEKFGDRIMYSEIGKFDTFLETNFIDVSKGDYGEYTALESYADRLLAFKHNLIHVINISSPSSANWYLEDTIKYSGVNFPFSVTKTKNGIAWISDDGCYLYDGRQVKNLLDKKLSVSKPSFTMVERPWNDWYRGTAHLKDVMIGYDAISNSLVLLRSPNDGTNYSNQAWIYDFDSNGWIYDEQIFTDSETYTNFITDWNNNLTVGYQNSAAVDFQKFLPISLSKTAQEFYTSDIDFGEPGLTKKIYKVIVTYKSDGAETTPFKYSIDGKQTASSPGGTFTGNFADTSGAWDVVELTTSSPISCQSIQIIFDAPSAGVFEINDITIEYRIIRNKTYT